MWECGLKQWEGGYVCDPDDVTPYVGVWIETQILDLTDKKLGVTPYVGVWIETRNTHPISHRYQVTPYVGVWIETLSALQRYG